MQIEDIETKIAACALCKERFAATETAHEPRPVVYPSTTAKVMIAGQAPGGVGFLAQGRVQAGGGGEGRCVEGT